MFTRTMVWLTRDNCCKCSTGYIRIRVLLCTGQVTESLGVNMFLITWFNHIFNYERTKHENGLDRVKNALFSSLHNARTHAHVTSIESCTFNDGVEFAILGGEIYVTSPPFVVEWTCSVGVSKIKSFKP